MPWFPQAVSGSVIQLWGSHSGHWKVMEGSVSTVGQGGLNDGRSRPRGVFYEWLLTGVQVSDQRTLTAAAAGFHTLPQVSAFFLFLGGMKFFNVFSAHQIIRFRISKTKHDTI